MPLWQKILIATGVFSAGLTALALFVVPSMSEQRMIQDTALQRVQLTERAMVLGSVDFERPIHVDGLPSDGRFGAQAAGPLQALRPILEPLGANEDELYKLLWAHTATVEQECRSSAGRVPFSPVCDPCLDRVHLWAWNLRVVVLERWHAAPRDLLGDRSDGGVVITK